MVKLLFSITYYNNEVNSPAAKSFGTSPYFLHFYCNCFIWQRHGLEHEDAIYMNYFTFANLLRCDVA